MRRYSGGVFRHPFPPFRGLVFDLDGVLILSRDAHRRAFEDVLAPFGITNFHYDRYAGWRTLEVFRCVFAESSQTRPDAEIVDCAQRKSKRARQILAEHDFVVPGCVPFLQKLALSYSLALASSGSRESVNAFLDKTGLGSSFGSVLSGDDVDQAKPDPEIFSRSIQALALQPEDCAVIEDAVAGIQAARRAGASAIGIGDEASLRAAGAGCVVSSLMELETLL